MFSILPIYLILILLTLKIIFHILIQESFPFVLVGIAIDEISWKEIVLSTSTHFLKPLFLCIRETGNGTNDARNPCKVALSNYEYF